MSSTCRLPAFAPAGKPARLGHIPKHLPIYVIGGTRDPVGAKSKGIEELLTAYRVADLQRVTYRSYPEARHELFNETNRDEVTRKLRAWLDEVTSRRDHSGRSRPLPPGRRPWA
jgi:alpha-beta hydrolase superfamily lysophospholipase